MVLSKAVGKMERTQFQQLIERNGNDNIEHIHKELYRNGFGFVHPRTKELMPTVEKSTKEQLDKIRKTLPCCPYHQQKNRQVSRKFKGISQLRKWVESSMQGKTDKRIKANLTVGRKTAQFKTVWYSKHQRRK